MSTTEQAINGPQRDVISYERMSSAKQRHGSSRVRQDDLAEEFARRNGFRLVDQIVDEGVSGFTGAHRERGKLGAFLDSVKAGKVRRGTILFVEDIDRLGREGIQKTLRKTIFELFDWGISLATPDQIYEADSVSDDELMDLAADLRRARRESERKAKFSGDNWHRRRMKAAQTDAVLTRRAPAWLRYDDIQKRFVAIPEAARAIRFIFSQAAVMGVGRLVRVLNGSAMWSPPPRRGVASPGWRQSYVMKILKNRAVIGECQPHTKRGGGKRIPIGKPLMKFEGVIDGTTFEATQRLLRERRTSIKGGRTGTFRNVFRGLVVCGYCGGAMTQRDRGKGPKGGIYLTCERGARGISRCRGHGVRYDELVQTILPNCAGLRPEEILANDPARKERSEELFLKIAAAKQSLSSAEEKVRNLMSNLENTQDDGMRVRYEEQIRMREEEARIAKTEAGNLQQSLDSLQAGPEFVKNWQVNIKSMLQKISRQDAVNERMKLNAHLREFVHQIRVFGKGIVSKETPAPTVPSRKKLATLQINGRSISLREAAPAPNDGSSGVREYAADVLAELELSAKQAADVPAFLGYLRRKAESRGGRYFRVAFQSGIAKDFVPRGSIAIGRVLEAPTSRQCAIEVGPSYSMRRPDLQTEWRKFRKSRSLPAAV